MAAASDPVVIVSAARTPLGRFMGDLSPFSAHKLGSHVIGEALQRAKLKPEKATSEMARAKAPQVTLEIRPMIFSCVGL